MLGAPFGEIRRPLRLLTGCGEDPVLGLVPLHRRGVHVVPGELVEQEERCKPRELVQRRAERMDVVEHAAGDNCVERPRVIELLERDLPIQLASGRIGVDRKDFVAGRCKCGRDSSFPATTNLEYPRGRRRELILDVGGKTHSVARVEHTSEVDRPPSGRHDPAERLRRLQAVTDVAIAHLSLDQLLDELLLRIRDALDADTAAFLLLDDTGSELVARAAKGIEEEVERGVRIPVGQGFAGRIAAARRPVVLDDVDHADVLNPVLREKGIKSLAGVPLITHDEVLGVVHVGTLTPRLFTPEDVELLEVVAQRAAVAIDRSLAHEQVLRLTELQRDFISLAAHELRTPVTTVYGLAATLARRDLPAETEKELRETLYRQSERMSRLVEQLLDMSRLDAASIEVSPELVALKPELEAIVRLSAAGREREVLIETPGTDDVVVDRSVLERVVGNLVTNALRHGAPPIRLVARQTDTHLRIVVEDNGEGVDPQFVPHLFDRFRRSEHARQAGTGAGLGLTIARAHARAHGGDVLYHAADGEGAMFELVIPRTNPPPAG
jgi:signal transduction histidine kinase